MTHKINSSKMNSSSDPKQRKKIPWDGVPRKDGFGQGLPLLGTGEPRKGNKNIKLHEIISQSFECYQIRYIYKHK